MNDIAWYQEFFGEDYLRIYTPFLSEEKTLREVDGISKLLHLPAGSSILDLCCGHGRHTIPLAQRGYQMTGLDLNESFLQRARTDALAQGVQVEWVHSDMRYIPFEHTFDAVINIFTSFGYLENEEENLHVLQQVHKALKPGGLFLLESVYQNKLVRSFSPYGIIRYDDGLLVLEERSFDLLSSRNNVHITMFTPDGQRIEHEQSVRLYTLSEVVGMFATVGLRLQAYYGGLDGSPLSMDSRLVVVGRKQE
ncbi:MAG: methyltransferase domain-containing protein [Ktedonobacteraceae bacterium]|nr:methyltransferase domain-containing protein [Ktedonobacteraceae bacterium]MBV9019675.1 methyltransferase domain-containing protein [Ktedonobacteraceae bacterium]